ncbi:MAG: hypothetical protein FWH20_08355 [Oscillospiraceae bacterium]|nr:hypothetical protein [Oscillospiraceae bacterium]
MKTTKTLALILALAMSLIFTACGESDTSNDSNNGSNTSSDVQNNATNSAGTENPSEPGEPDDYSDYDDNDNDTESFPFSENIDVSAFNASLFDGRINFDDGSNVILTAPLTYEKFLEAGYEITESSLEQLDNIAEKGRGTSIYLAHPDAKNGREIRLNVINHNDDEMTVLETFKAGGFTFFFTNERAMWYVVMPMLVDDDSFNPFSHGIDGNSFTYEQFTEYIFGKLGVPSAVVTEDFNQWANFHYIYDYSDYSITIGVRENPDNGTLNWGTFGYDSK